MDYRVGEKLLFIADEFDGYSEELCEVTEVHNDHAIAKGNGMTLWIDEDTKHMFKKYRR